MVQNNVLVFVKRVGEKYPGNEGPHPGTTMQEVLRCLIDRIKYVDKQRPHDANEAVLRHFRDALLSLEFRAAELHGRAADFIKYADEDEPEFLPVCNKCMHIGCGGECHP